MIKIEKYVNYSDIRLSLEVITNSAKSGYMALIFES